MVELATTSALWSEIMIALGNDDQEVIKKKLSDRADGSIDISKAVFSTGGVSNTTFLMHAAAHGAVRCMEALILAGSNVNAKDSDGETAIFYAVGNQQIDAVDMLVRFGAGVNEQSYLGRTPLMYSAAMQNCEMVEHLISLSAFVDKRDNGGFTALSYAVQGPRKTDVEMLRLLIRYGVDPRDQYDRLCFFTLPTDRPQLGMPFAIVPLSRVRAVVNSIGLGTVFANPDTCKPGTAVYEKAFS